MDRLRAAALDEIVGVEGIGPKIAESVHAWFCDDPDNLRIVDKLVGDGVNMTEEIGSRAAARLPD